MLTPIEIQGITFKTGRGYKKEDVDSFMKALHHDYEIMYKENMELKEKITTLSDGIQYYKNLEKTLQKALVLAEKTSEETKDAAQKQAEAIETQAKLNAQKIAYEARQELDRVEVKTQELLQNFELYKTQFKQILSAQLELVDSSTFDIKIRNLKSELSEIMETDDAKSEIDKVVDIDKTEVQASAEEVLQAKKLAKQVSEEEKAEKKPLHHAGKNAAKDKIKNFEDVVKAKAEEQTESASVKAEEADLKQEENEEDTKVNDSQVETMNENMESNVWEKLKEEAAATEEIAQTQDSKTFESSSDELDLEKELAGSVEEIEKEEKDEEQQEEADEIEQKLKEESEVPMDTETDLEIKMLQKLLNEIKKSNDNDTSDEEFEFINTDSDE